MEKYLDENGLARVADYVNGKEKLIFKGTSAEWESLTAEEQAKYSVRCHPDIDTGDVADAVTDGDLRAVSSNAVFDYTKALKALFSPTRRVLGEGIRKFLDESNSYTKTATVTGVYQFTLFKHNHGNTVTISVNGVRQCSCPFWGTNSGETVVLDQTDICYTPTIFVNKGDVITISSDNSSSSGTARWFVNNVNYWGIEE